MEASERCRALIQRCSHHDKDERYMAISDLRSEMDGVDTMDAALQTTLRQTLLQRLDDASSDVQAIAVNCCSSMVEKLDSGQVLETIATLCTLSNLESDGSDTDLNEIYVEALRGVLEHVPWTLGEQVSTLMLPILIASLSDARHERSSDSGRFWWCIMLLQTILDRFVGCPIGADHYQRLLTLLLDLISNQIDYNNSLIPNVVASFTNSCPSSLLADLIHQIVTQIDSRHLSHARAAALIVTLSHMARKAGPRLVQHGAALIPALITRISPRSIIDLTDAHDDLVAVRYHALGVLDGLVRMGAAYIAPYGIRLLDLTLQLMVLDPNIVVDDDNDAAMNEFDGDDWGLEPDAAPDEDAGDTTWKVRLASLRLLSEWIMCRALASIRTIAIVRDLIDRLVDRFNERDTAVQAQVFDTFTVLLRHLGGDVTIDVAPIVTRLHPHLSSSHIDVKRAAVQTLLALVTIFTESILSSSSINILSLILSAVVDRSDTSAQLIALDALKIIVQSDQSRVLIIPILQALISVISEEGQLQAAPFDVIACLCRYHDPAPIVSPDILNALFIHLFDLARSLPITRSETKVSACLALAEFSACFGANLTDHDLHQCLELFLSSIEMRSVEQTGLQCLIIITEASKAAHTALHPYADRICRTLLDLITARIADTALLGSHLCTLSAMIDRYPHVITDSILSDCLSLTADLHDITIITSMHQLDAILIEHGADRYHHTLSGASSIETLIDQAMDVLTHAESLQRIAIQSSQALLIAIAGLYRHTDPNDVIQRLLHHPGSYPVSVFAATLAACYVQLYEIDQLVHHLTRLMTITDGPDPILIVSLIGEIARRSPLLPDPILAQWFTALRSYATCGDEHVKSAAATALGACTAAAPAALFPRLLDDIQHQTDPVAISFHLQAMKEVLIGQHLPPHVADTIFTALLQHAASPNEGARAIASECIGKLAALDRALVADRIQQSLRSSSAWIRASLVTAVKFYYTQMRDDDGVPADALLPLIQDPDLQVRRQAFLAFVALFTSATSTAHVDTLLAQLMPLASLAIRVQADLIRRIDFGAFQETIDEGLLLRQAAYLFLQTVCERYPDQIPVRDLVLALAQYGAHDPDLDLQCAAYGLMSSIADRFAPGHPMDFLDQLPAYLMPSVKSGLAQLKRNPGDSDARRLLTAFIIAIHKLHQLPGARADCPQLHLFYRQVLRTSLIATLLHEHGLLVEAKF